MKPCYSLHAWKAEGDDTHVGVFMYHPNYPLGAGLGRRAGTQGRYQWHRVLLVRGMVNRAYVVEVSLC